jgi:CubicO group peptidase (beta-lactamase class C family)
MTLHSLRRAVGLSLLVGVPIGGAAAQDDPASIIARIEAVQTPDRQGLDGYTLQQLMQRFRVPGVSIAVIKDFRIHWAKSYGVADVETGRAVDERTRFQAASISKPVAALAAVRLAQEGRFSLDDDINSLLKSWKVPDAPWSKTQPVTPRSLLSHTSGADDGFGFPGYEPSSPRPTPLQVIAGQSPSNTGPVLFARPPYQGFKYSGGGTIIMQQAMMDVTGTPFAELMQTQVLGPLGMTNSSYEQPPAASVHGILARAHGGRGQAMGAAWHVYPEQEAAGLWTTPSDLARVVIEVQKAIRGPKGDVLTQSAAREMLAPVGTGPYGVGFAVEKRGEGWYFGHGGSNWGFRCNLLAHVRKGHGVVIMTNADNGGPVISELEARIAAAYNWDLLHKPLLR